MIHGCFSGGEHIGGFAGTIVFCANCVCTRADRVVRPYEYIAEHTEKSEFVKAIILNRKMRY